MAAYQAAWVFPASSPPIPNGVVAIDHSRIHYVGPRTGYRSDDALDLNEHLEQPVAILPGLVNAHTHLEFSGLQTPLGESGSAITDWIPQVIAWRRARDSEAAGEDAKRAAIGQGVRESIACGVARLGEIATSPWRAEMHPSISPRCTTFLELIALAQHQNESARQAAFAHLQGGGDSKRGLSPHAPYTVNLELLEDAVDLSQRTGAVLQMHLAESLEELEFISTNTGPFRDMFEQAGLWAEADLPCGMQPLDYLERLAKSSRCLIAHGNYLQPKEIEFLGQHDHLTVVFCPRTHAFFGHREHPALAMLASGVNVALGTDSRASNPDLSLFAEMQFLARQSVLPPSDILRMATRNGALALGDQESGVLESGRRASLTVIGIDSQSDPYEALYSPHSRPKKLMLDGRWVGASASGA